MLRAMSMAILRERFESLWRRLRGAPLGRALSLLSFGFLAAALLGHGQAMLALRPDRAGWLWLLLGVGFSLLSLVASALLWGVVLRWLGQRPRWQPLLLAYLRTNLRKVLPGGVWHLASRVQLLRQGPDAPQPLLPVPLPASMALVAVLLEPLLAAVAALALVGAGGLQGGLALVALLPLLLLLPRWLPPLLIALERRKAASLGLDPAAAALPLPLPATYPWQGLLVAAGFVLLRFAGLACCVLAFDLQLALGWGSWLAAFALAWTAGLVVPGAPAGLGVFEAVLLLRLAGTLPQSSVLAVALSYRLVVTLADALAALTATADQRGDGLARFRN